MDIEQDETALNVGINISSGDYSANFHASLQFDEAALIMSSKDNQQIIILKYAQTCSIGLQNGALILLTEAKNDKADEEACDELIASITKGTEGNYVLSGNYLLNIDFSHYGANVMREVYERISEHMGEAAECGSNCNEDFQEGDQMLTAKHFDEDCHLIREQIKEQFEEEIKEEEKFEEQIKVQFEGQIKVQFEGQIKEQFDKQSKEQE